MGGGSIDCGKDWKDCHFKMAEDVRMSALTISDSVGSIFTQETVKYS